LNHLLDQKGRSVQEEVNAESSHLHVHSSLPTVDAVFLHCNHQLILMESTEYLDHVSSAWATEIIAKLVTSYGFFC
jgi:hypothetical protein